MHNSLTNLKIRYSHFKDSVLTNFLEHSYSTHLNHCLCPALHWFQMPKTPKNLIFLFHKAFVTPRKCSIVLLTQNSLLKKAKCDAGPKHVRVWDGKCCHSRRSSGPIYVVDGFFRLIYVETDFSDWSMWRRIFPIDLCGWQNFPSHTCFGPATRLAFLTVISLKYSLDTIYHPLTEEPGNSCDCEGFIMFYFTVYRMHALRISKHGKTFSGLC
jgi:hypothetical protein